MMLQKPPGQHQPADGSGHHGRPSHIIADFSNDLLVVRSESPLLGQYTASIPSHPRGKPQVDGHPSRASQLLPIPMPQPPPKPTTRTKTIPLPLPPKKELRTKPYVLEIPAAAPHYPSNGRLDFFAWSGQGPEDVLSDNIIRQGYYDKPSPAQNETGSAKASVFPCLKHKSGLQTLSSLFTSILGQRRTHGQITSTPTFKPPPRVTLTDTKRETWLRDLANPSISLRRLSRTIPHGIRGKVLLEQCLSKRIPTERAVWLAKCVGANEIRAFKRKGISGALALGGEAKWIRDWTAFVEQFVESVIASCGEKDWKERITYATRLSTHLYTEHLLDRDHYIDWLLTSLETTVLAKIPMWLMLAQVYWKDLLGHRRSGRRLIALLCSQLHVAFENPDRDLFTSVTDRIVSLLKDLVLQHAESFVFPKMWPVYGNTLAYHFSQEEDAVSEVCKSIELRNMALSNSDRKSGRSPRRVLIDILDRSLWQPFDSSVARACWHTSNDRHMLAKTVLEWSTSSSRHGVTKIYVGARLLRNWSRAGVDINDTIIEFVGANPSTTTCDRVSLFHFVSELTRSGHFSTSRYIQWLIARGGIRGPAELQGDGLCASRLLAELPSSDLPDNLERLRKTMLSRALFSVDDELAKLNFETNNITRLLPGLIGEDMNNSGSDNDCLPDYGRLRILSLSRAMQSELGLWIRSVVSQHAAPTEATSVEDWKPDDGDVVKSAMTPREFNMIRAILEDTGDISILADVLKISSSSSNLSILASIADTLNRHLETFAAIGALGELFDTLVARLQSFTMTMTMDTTLLLTSLVELSARIPHAEDTALQLTQELARSNRKTAAEACSPVSDQMAEALQGAEGDFSDEIEKVLASGNSMDLSTLKRLFDTIFARLESMWTKPHDQQLSCATLLARLKDFDIKNFDILILSRLSQVISYSTRPSLLHALSPLISLGCLSLKEVLASIRSAKQNASGPADVARACCDALALLFGPPPIDVMSNTDAYRFEMKKCNFRKDYQREVLSVIRQAMENCRSWESVQESDALFESPQLSPFLQYAILNDIEAVREELTTPLVKNPACDINLGISRHITRLLDPMITGEALTRQNTQVRLENTLSLANDFTLPFCQLNLQAIIASDPDAFAVDDDSNSYGLATFEEAIHAAVIADNRSWTSLLSMLDPQISRHLCQYTERQLIEAMPTGPTAENPIPKLNNANIASRFLSIVETTAHVLDPNQAQATVIPILARLNGIWQLFSAGDAELRATICDNWLPILLNLVTLHARILGSNKAASDSRTRLLLSLCSIHLEISKQQPQLLPLIQHDQPISLLTRIFDLCLLLVDDLPEEGRNYCLRALKDKISNPNIRYILGASSAPMEWLHLNQKGKLSLYPLRRWEVLSEPTPNVGENDTSLSLTLFQARKL